MTYYGGKRTRGGVLARSGSNTIKIAEEIPENKYDFKAGARLPAAIAQDARRTSRSTHAAFQHSHPRQQDHRPEDGELPGDCSRSSSAEEAQAARRRPRSIAFLKAEGDKFASFLEGLPESFLAEHGDDAAGRGAADEEPASRCCCRAKEHEMHHRGQLMTMRADDRHGAAPDAADAGAHGADAGGRQPPGRPRDRPSVRSMPTAAPRFTPRRSRFCAR